MSIQTSTSAMKYAKGLSFVTLLAVALLTLPALAADAPSAQQVAPAPDAPATSHGPGAICAGF